ncbi:hypothetical protein [Natronobeatus ordinarius]|uniref:hypothetical protein n=1 Tax=Natronobeatus ordinarius TaxID=2963433 RepID=UPI0020CC166E|nr:hypothetical protein [Natronobeatus ordinarius]
MTAPLAFGNATRQRFGNATRQRFGNATRQCFGSRSTLPDGFGSRERSDSSEPYGCA